MLPPSRWRPKLRRNTRPRPSPARWPARFASGHKTAANCRRALLPLAFRNGKRPQFKRQDAGIGRHPDGFWRVRLREGEFQLHVFSGAWVVERELQSLFTADVVKTLAPSPLSRKIRANLSQNCVRAYKHAIIALLTSEPVAKHPTQPLQEPRNTRKSAWKKDYTFA